MVKLLPATITGGAALLCSWVIAEPLRIATWNLEHLNADGSEGCITRTEDDFERITRSIQKQNFDVVAFQEVKDVAAAQKVFPATTWNIEMSNRPQQESSLECREAPERYRQHLGTGFAIRQGIKYERHDDVKELGLSNDFNRWGTDISIKLGSSLRLLSVHLIPGCWSGAEDQDGAQNDACTNLRKQFEILVEWRDARLRAEESFVILGDFNRRLALEEDWGWMMLNTRDKKLKLLTSAGSAKCDPYFPEFIDHVVVGDLTQSLYVGNSFLEGPRIAKHPDHCAVSADFELQ